MRKVILSIIFCVTAVIVRADELGELPKGATAKAVEVATECYITANGKTTKCKYDAKTGEWTPAGIAESSPQVANCLDAAAAGIYNSTKIANEFNTLLGDFNKNKALTDAEISALKENYAAIMEKLKDLSNVEVNSCDLCDHETVYESITFDNQGNYIIGETSSSGCVETSKKIAGNFVTIGQAIAADRARLTEAEERLTEAEATLENHGGRISALENANNDYATKESVKKLKTEGEEKHNELEDDITFVWSKLNTHIKNCNGDGGDTNIIEFATCDLCSNTNGISMASLSFQPRKEGSSGKPEVPAQIVSGTTPVDGCEGAISQVEENIAAVVEAVSTLLPLPPKLDEHIDWANDDSKAQWDAIADSLLRKTTYTGSVKSLAEALDPNKEGKIGGQVMILAATSPTNYYAIDIGKLDFPECDGLSSNDVENLVKTLLNSFGGGCACTPDEYIKEETDPVWEEEKAGYVTITAFQEAIESLRQEISEMGVRLDAAEFKANEAWGLAKANEGDLSTVYNELELAIERIAELERQTNNATGGN
jgi:hypothetical protein